MTSIRIALCAAFVASGIGAAQGAPGCDPFKHHIQDLRGYWSTYRYSVVEVLNGSSAGTAFLVDARLGLFLTAAHVVGAPDQPATKVILRSEPDTNRPNVDAKVLAWERNADIDIALLQVEGDNIFSNTPELDVSFNDSERWAAAGFIGASKSDATTRLDMRNAESINQALGDGSNRYALVVPTEGADSGAPVIVAGTSFVSGMVVRNEGINTAIVQPSVLFTEFLDRYAVEPVLEFEQMSAGKVREAFQIVPTKTNSNWRLVGFLKKFKQLLSSHTRIERTLIEPRDCPFTELVLARQLGANYVGVAYEIAAKYASASFREIGTQIYQLANLDTSELGPLAKAGLYREAASYFGKEIYAKLATADDTKPESGLFVLSGLGKDKINALQTESLKGNQLSALLLDYQVAMTRAAQLGDPVVLQKNPSDRAMESVFASYVGTAVSVTSNWTGLHFQEAANLFLQEGKYAEATSAFAAAWQNGIKKPAISQGFKYSLEASGGPNVVAALPGIETFGSLSSQELLTSIHGGQI